MRIPQPVTPVPTERWVKDCRTNKRIKSFPTKELADAHALELNRAIGLAFFVVEYSESDYTRM